jgi:polysaccharide export outer membrane protein
MINYRITLKLLFFCGVFLLIFSCNKRAQEILYFQGQLKDSTTVLHTDYTPLIQSNDILDIKLVSANDEASKLFTPTYDSKSAVSYSSGIAARGGYLVGLDGFISLPYIGRIEVAGKSRMEVEKIIEQKLSEFLKDPLIQIQIVNFKITVLGEVNRPGTYNIPNEKVTIFEALGIAGDLTLAGKRKTVKIIREEKNKRVEHIIDLTSSEIFNSPCYFLRQNDIIYISPSSTKINLTSYSQLYMTIITGLSFVLSTITLFLRF